MAVTKKLLETIPPKRAATFHQGLPLNSANRGVKSGKSDMVGP